MPGGLRKEGAFHDANRLDKDIISGNGHSSAIRKHQTSTKHYCQACWLYTCYKVIQSYQYNIIPNYWLYTCIFYWPTMHASKIHVLVPINYQPDWKVFRGCCWPVSALQNTAIQYSGCNWESSSRAAILDIWDFKFWVHVKLLGRPAGSLRWASAILLRTFSLSGAWKAKYGQQQRTWKWTGKQSHWESKNHIPCTVYNIKTKKTEVLHQYNRQLVSQENIWFCSEV